MRTLTPALAGTLFSVLLLSPSAPGQDLVGPGFARTAQQSAPAQGVPYRTLSTGDRVVFDGLTVDLYDASGLFLANLGSLPGFVFPSFVAISPAESRALVGESSTGGLYRVDLSGAGLALVASLAFNYDAVFLDESSAVVSAATCGFGCGNDLVRVDVLTGATQGLSSVPGASGPLALGSNGDLYYTTVSGSFPPPPGSSQVLRWSAALVNSGAPLSIGDAQVLVSGLNGAAAMAVDPVLGAIVVAESVFGSTSRVRLFAAGGAPLGAVIESPNYLSAIELRRDGGLGHFYPYQPADGVYLTYSSGGDVHTVRPQRPQASITQQGSAVTLTVSGAPANGALLILWTSQGLWSPVEASYFIPGLGFQIHSGVAPSSMRRLPFLIPTDAVGTGTFSFFDGGSLGGTLVFQPLVMNAAGRFVGSSTAAFN
jgi:hypothetical protein